MTTTPAQALVLTPHSQWPCLPYQNTVRPLRQSGRPPLLTKLTDSSRGLNMGILFHDKHFFFFFFSSLFYRVESVYCSVVATWLCEGNHRNAACKHELFFLNKWLIQMAKGAVGLLENSSSLSVMIHSRWLSSCHLTNIWLYSDFTASIAPFIHVSLCKCSQPSLVASDSENFKPSVVHLR